MQSHSHLLCLVVSLKNSTQRRQSINASLSALHIPFTFIDAIDASAGFDTRTESEILRPDNATISEGELACAMSHRKAYDVFLASDSTHALILEDDAIPTAALERFCLERHYQTGPLQLLFHSRARVLKSKGFKLFDDISTYPLAISCTGAVAYSVDRPTATELRRANTPVRSLADWPLDISSLNARVVHPMIVDHPPRTGNQSLLSPKRDNNIKLVNPTRWLSRAYLQRKWRKLISSRIS